MPKSCMKKNKSCFRVSFNKVVSVHKGAPKKLKRVNATKLAYAVLRKNGPINAKFMKSLVKKHKQHGSTKKAVRETIKTLHALNMRLCMPLGGITSIGAYHVHNRNVHSATTWRNKLSTAKTVLLTKKVYLPHKCKR